MKYCHRCWSPLANTEYPAGHVFQYCPSCENRAWSTKIHGVKYPIGKVIGRKIA